MPIWGAILPTDRAALVEQQIQLTQNGLAARRSALAALGVEDPERELDLMAKESAVGSRQSAEGNGTT